MYNHILHSDNRKIRSVTILGIIANVALAALKVLFGNIAGSMALVADGVHSLSDTVTDFAVLLGAHFGSKAPDRKHQYGHGRMETLASLFIAAVLVFVGGAMVYRASIGIARKEVITPGISVLFIAAVSVVVKEILYRATRNIAVKSHSSALYANAWHHRSDSLSSVVVMIGFVSIKLGFNYGDHIATIAVGVLIILVGGKILSDCLREFTEVSVEPETVRQIRRIVEDTPQIRQWHKLRTRSVGREIFIDLHILVDAGLNIKQAHRISENLEKTLHESIPRPINVIVHIEPDLPDFRKQS